MTFDVDAVLAKLKQNDKIALLSGKLQPHSGIYNVYLRLTKDYKELTSGTHTPSLSTTSPPSESPTAPTASEVPSSSQAYQPHAFPAVQP